MARITCLAMDTFHDGQLPRTRMTVNNDALLRSGSNLSIKRPDGRDLEDACQDDYKSVIMAWVWQD